MDVATAVATAFGLAGAAGLNAWLPVVAAAVLDRTGVVDLAAPFDQLSTTPALAILGVVFIADFVGDKIPAVDSVLHAVGSVRPNDRVAIERAVKRVYGTDLGGLEAQWVEYCRKR